MKRKKEKLVKVMELVNKTVPHWTDVPEAVMLPDKLNGVNYLQEKLSHVSVIAQPVDESAMEKLRADHETRQKLDGALTKALMWPAGLDFLSYALALSTTFFLWPLFVSNPPLSESIVAGYVVGGTTTYLELSKNN